MRYGYHLDVKSVNAFDFGVIQNREGAQIIIGWRKTLKLSYPDFKKIKNCWGRDDIFNDLPALKPAHTDSISYYSGPINEYLKQTELRNGVDFVSQHTTQTP